MNWVEVMGPSGIGKSTFLNVVVSQRKNKKDWVLLDEALKEVTLKSLRNNPFEKFLRLYLNQNIINSNKRKIPGIILNKKQAYIKEAGKYEDMINHYLNFYFLESGKSPVEKTYRISLYKSIIEDLCLFDLKQYQKTVILDEGPFNHLPNIEKLNKAPTVLPKGVIFCDVDQNINFQRIKARELQRGRPSPIHKGLNDEELKIDINKRRTGFLKKRETLISYGIPFIDINLEEISAKKVMETTSFLNFYSKHR